MYLFIAVFFFLCCFGMSRYSLYLERKLDTSRDRQVLARADDVDQSAAAAPVFVGTDPAGLGPGRD